MNYRLKFAMSKDLFDITYLLQLMGMDMSMVPPVHIRPNNPPERPCP